jgi:hypothetical protein
MFVQAMEAATERCLSPRKRGRRKKAGDDKQSALAFAEE